MPNSYFRTIGESINGGGTNLMRSVSGTWALSFNNNDYYSSPVSLPTSAPTDPNFTWTITSGAFPTLDGSATEVRSWAKDPERLSAFALGIQPFMCIWGKNNGSTGNISVIVTHKHTGGTVDFAFSVASTSIPNPNYFRVSPQVPSRHEWGSFTIVEDDVIGLKVYAANSGMEIWHASLVLVPCDIYLPHLTYNASVTGSVTAFPTSVWGLNGSAGWSSTATTASGDIFAPATGTTAFDAGLGSGSTMYTPYGGGASTSDCVWAASSITNNPYSNIVGLSVSQSATQSTVTSPQPIYPASWKFQSSNSPRIPVNTVS